jgi:hypothetical protein
LQGISSHVVVFAFAIWPWICVPFVIYFNLDPTYALERWIYSFPFYKNSLIFQTLFVLGRFGGCLLCCIDISRYLLILLSCTYIIGRLSLDNIRIVGLKRISDSRAMFLTYSSYLRLLMIVKLFDDSLGSCVSEVLGMCSIFLIACGYATISLGGSLIPFQLYIFFPFGLAFGSSIIRDILGTIANLHHISTRLLQRWTHDSAVIYNRKFIVRKLRSTSAIKIHCKFLGTRLCYLERSTVLDFFEAVFMYTTDVVLSFREF